MEEESVGGSVLADHVRVIDLSKAPGSRSTWSRPLPVVLLWGLVEPLFVSNPFQPSSRIRCMALRAFGARIGRNVVFRPRTRVRFPWKLEIGANSWIGEGVWFHNQDFVRVGSNAVISQETMLTTGTHDIRGDMALRTRPIRIGDGAWIAARCLITGGVSIGRSAVIGPMSLVQGEVQAGQVIRLSSKTMSYSRFD